MGPSDKFTIVKAGLSLVTEAILTQIITRCDIACGKRCRLKGHCIEFKYYADGIHSGLTPPG